MVKRTAISQRPADSIDKPLARILILSGGTGRTAELVVSAAMAQFTGVSIDLIRRPNVRTPAAAMRILKEAHQLGAIVCHTLVEPKLHAAVEARIRLLGIPSVDILGPTLAVLGDHLLQVPQGRPGLLYQLHREQFDRLDAVDFTLAHDDGCRLHDLDQADVVLVGASRVSKSVTCFCLAARGVRTANIPLVKDCQPPIELTRLPPEKVVGLTMNAARLAALRQTRINRITQRPVHGYADVPSIAEELRQIAETIRRNHWRCIDVSYKATEEVVSEIVGLIALPPDAGSISKKKRG